jgi:hypothetical protein
MGAMLVCVLLVFILIFDLLTFLFSTPGAILVGLFVFFITIRLVTDLSTFPGSFWFWKRSIQLEFNREYCTRLNQATSKLLNFL